MKTNKLITLTGFLFCLNMQIHAQFNTIGTINNRRINTTNPPKPHVALTDSILTDTHSDETASDSNENGHTVDNSLGYQDMMPLVSLPLKNIHINSQADYAQWH